ncbi:hypothetical protein HBE96_06715 [Clostridium sp. P21]|uniref:Uncharacterized protein n=1 Tax=Clostridium muellerianum TaxID=2716538 RepID=A0A7Y0HLW3_9CLOT|nr:hypothetical protein [Clostridium muellerianum]NMM62384.1 hypothetical protein [Clostridium muellerianum]
MEQNTNEQETVNTKKENGKKIISRILSIALILIGTLMLYPTVTQRREGSNNNFMIFIHNAIIVYLLTLVVYVIRNKIFFKGKKKVGLLTFSSILLFISLCNFTNAVKENSKELAAGKYIMALCESKVNDNPILLKNKEKDDYGKLNSLVAIVKEEANKSYSISKTFNSELKENTSKNHIISNNVLRSEDKIKEFRNSLSELNKALAKYESDINSNKVNFDKKMSEFKSENTIFEKNLINEFNFWRKEKYDKSIKDINEKKVLREKMDKYLEFMESKQGSYKIVNNKIMFGNQSDVDKCNELIEGVKKAGSSW